MAVEPESKGSMSLYYTGRELLEAGEASGALARLNESWSVQPHANAAYHIARALVLPRRALDARKWFGRAYELHSSNNMIATAHANAMHEQGESHEAKRVLCRVVERASNYGPAQRLMAPLQP